MTHPAEPTSPPAQPEAAGKPVQGRSSWPLLLAGLSGLVVGVLVVGGVWLLSGRDGVDTRAVTAPEKLGDYVLIDQTELHSRSPLGKRSAERFRAQNEGSSQLLSKSYGEAGAIVRVYSDQAMDKQFTVLVFRAKSAHPRYVPHVEPADLGLAKATYSAEEFGEVSCEVRNDPTPQGQTPAPDSAHTISCSRTNDALTVEIQPNGQAGLDPQHVAALVDEVWEAVS